MLARSLKRRATDITIGTSVRVPVPFLDRAKSDHRNVIAMVMEVKEEDQYKLGTKFGVLQGLYARNQFETCPNNFLQDTDVLKEKIISLREAAGLASVGSTSQGFVKCSCKKVCGTRCKCASKKMVCNSRCHRNRSCNNYYD